MRQSAGGAWHGHFMEDTKRDMRCWEPGGQPRLPVCSGEPGRGHSTCKAQGSRSDGPCLKEGKRRESREESEPEHGGARGPTGSTTSSSSCKEVLARGSALPMAHSPAMAPAEPLTLAHTTQRKRHGLGREPKGGEWWQRPLPGSPLPSLVARCLRAARAGVRSGGSQPRRLQLLWAARPATLS